MARKTLQEQIDRMKKLSKIHEASYKSVLSDDLNSDNNDTLSRSMYSSSTQQMGNDGLETIHEDGEVELPSGITNPPPPQSGDTGMPPASSSASADITASDLDMMNEPELPAGQEDLTAAPASDSLGEPAMGQPSRDEVENELLHLQVAAMQKLNSKLGELDDMVMALGQKYQQLNKDVEEVREPSDSEKLKSRKLDSHPFYYNLNDMWNNNYFQSRQDQFGEGMVKLDDGTFVADFDTLPKLNTKDVRDSFTKY